MARKKRVAPPAAPAGMTPVDASWAFRQLCRSFLRGAGGGDAVYRRVRDFARELEAVDPFERLAALQGFLAELGVLDEAERFVASWPSTLPPPSPHPFDHYARL